MTNEIDKIKILSDEAGSIIKLKNSMLMKIRKNNNLSNDEKSYLFNKIIVQLNDVLTNIGMELSTTLESIPIYTFYLKNMTYLTIYERAELIAEIKDIERFYGYKKLLAYAGFTPNSNTYNKRLHNTLLRIGHKLILGNLEYSLIFEDTCQKYEQKNPSLSEKHITNKAKRIIIKKFIKELYNFWRQLDEIGEDL